jgi:alginate O-acetyltransferase complex protein AlgI
VLLFSSAYFTFLIAIFFLYWPLQRVRAAGLAILLLANYFFYAKWGLIYLAAIPLASTCDYLFALGMEHSKTAALRRLLLAASITVNLGLLIASRKMGFALGLSFYAFQALSYTIDVYRRDAKPANSLLLYLSAVSFFPTTLAGPITRPAQLMPQLEKKEKTLAAGDGGRALFLIGLGLMKKMLIADYLADNLVNRVFDTPQLYSGLETLVAVYGYAVQLYYDFSGYTDIAIGSALLLGLKLPANFNRPYSAENIADFWRRWHISLSNWLRDYLYFSLPGLRSKWKGFTYLNLVITMFLGGLWHGLSYNFAIWGLLHGCGLAAQRAWQVARGSQKPAGNKWTRILRIIGTANFVCFAWIFFRAPNFSAAMAMLERIESLSMSTANITAPFMMVLLIGILCHYAPKKLYTFSMDLYVKSPAVVQAAAMALLVLAIEFTSSTGAAPFIYTKF